MAATLLTSSVALAVLLMTLEGTEAIQCYSCSSVDTADCGTPFYSSLVSTCGGSHCSKVVTTAAETGLTTVVRSCQTGTPVTSCQYGGSSISAVTTCYCQTNYCNSAQGLTYNNKIYVPLIAMSAAVVLLVKLQGLL